MPRPTPLKKVAEKELFKKGVDARRRKRGQRSVGKAVKPVYGGKGK